MVHIIIFKNISLFQEKTNKHIYITYYNEHYNF